MPIGSGIVYNAGDLILSQVSGSGTAFLETKIAAATSSIVYFDSTARINSASLNSITVGTSSYVSGSTSIITNLTASNISASGNISASLFVGSHTGSTFGTSSWASNALTASFLPVGTYNITSSWSTNALTASSVSSTSNAFIRGGNSFGANAMLGINDNFRLDIETNGAAIISLTGSNVGIGTTSPGTLFQVHAAAGGNNWTWFNGNVGSTLPTGFTTGVSIGRNYSSGLSEANLIWGHGVSSNQYFAIGKVSGSTSYSEQLRIDINGNLGIGTTNPTTKLHVSGSVTALDGTFVSNVTSGTDRYFLNCYGTSTNWIFSIYENNNTAYLNSYSNMAFRANQNGGSGGYFIFSGANVGIGTTIPSGKLHVVGTANVIELSQATAGAATYYVMDNTVETGGRRYRFGYSGASSDKGSFTIYNATDNITPFTILTGGNVGIGTTVPAYLLDVSGSSRHGYRASDTHQFTGSVNISGSVTAISFTGSLSGSVSNALTASYLTPANSYTITNLTASNISASGYVSASAFWGTTGTFTNLSSSGPVVVSGSNAYIQLLPVGNIAIPTNTTASYIYVSGSTNDLYFTQYQGPFTNTTRLRWLESNMYTGILFGGQISSTPGSTTFNVKSGSGLIVSMNATTGSDPYPTIKQVNWPDYTNRPITNSGSAKITYVGLDNTGQIVQQTNAWGSTDINQWDTQINLGVVLHLSGSVSTGVFNSPQISYGYPQKTDDFTRAFGPLKISGHTLQASGSGLSIQKTGGVAFREGANYYINPNHPSTVTENAITASKIYRYYLSGSTPIIDTGVGNAGYTTLDITKYNNNGVLTDLQGSFNNQFTLQRVFWIPNSPTNAFIVYYGNAVYSTLLDAINAVGTEAFTEAPNTALNAIELATIVIEGDSTNLTTTNKCTIVQSGLFRNVGGVGSGGTTPVVTSLDSLSDVAITGPSQGDLLIYGNGTQWVNSKTLVGAYKLTGSLSTNDGVSVISLSASVVSASSIIVNNITSSGPIIYDNAVLLDYGSVSTPVVSTNYVVLQNLTGSYNSAFFDYFASSGSNFRAGTVIAGWSGSSVNYTEYATTDVGNTNQLSMSVDLSGSFVRLLTRVSTTINWNIKTAGRYL